MSRSLTAVDPNFTTSPSEKNPEMIDVAIALLTLARGRPAPHVATLIDATSILLAAVRSPGEITTSARSETPTKTRKPRRDGKVSSAVPIPAASPAESPPSFEHNGLRIADGVLTFGDKTVRLTPREVQLTAAMARAMPHLMDYQQLAKRVWERPFDDQAKMLISQTAGVLRPKLASVGLDLKTVHGQGYTLQVAT
jgi:DNA-binding response OmpR family regulator